MSGAVRVTSLLSAGAPAPNAFTASATLLASKAPLLKAASAYWGKRPVAASRPATVALCLSVSRRVCMDVLSWMIKSMLIYGWRARRIGDIPAGILSASCAPAASQFGDALGLPSSLSVCGGIGMAPHDARAAGADLAGEVVGLAGVLPGDVAPSSGPRACGRRRGRRCSCSCAARAGTACRAPAARGARCRGGATRACAAAALASPVSAPRCGPTVRFCSARLPCASRANAGRIGGHLGFDGAVLHAGASPPRPACALPPSSVPGHSAGPSVMPLRLGRRCCTSRMLRVRQREVGGHDVAQVEQVGRDGVHLLDAERLRLRPRHGAVDVVPQRRHAGQLHQRGAAGVVGALQAWPRGRS